MAFWGVEVKPGKPYTHRFDQSRGRLRVSQATLGNGKEGIENLKAKSVVQCNVGEKSPILLCSLIADVAETCHLELEFEEQEEVIFSVLGQRSVHLSGYFIGSNGYNGGDDSDSYGEDIAETESEDSEFDYSDDEYESDFIDDDDIEMFNPSPPRKKSGVVIEEIVEEEKQANGEAKQKARRRKRQVIDSDDDVSNDVGDDVSPKDLQLVAKTVASAQLDSEDEDGFPTSIFGSGKAKSENDDRKRKIEERDRAKEGPKKKKKIKDNDESEKRKKVVNEKSEKKKKKKKEKEKEKEKVNGKTEEGVERESKGGEEKEVTEPEGPQTDRDPVSETEPSGKEEKEKKDKKKKKKKKNKNQNKDLTMDPEKDEIKEKEEKKVKKQSNKARTFPNGLIIEDISMGKPDGKKASRGSRVFVNYIGKLQNGTIFDSNVGQRPFKFRLGIGEVICGWDVGINGMRVGDKRRLTIPPTMGYGDKAVGKIPKNSWLVFDVELVDVKSAGGN